MAESFKYKTLEEIGALQVYPEPEAAVGGSIEPDAGSYSSPGYVYFMSETGGTDYFKVGLTSDPRSRYGNLQTGNPRRLMMNLVWVPSMLDFERQLLAAMSQRYRQGDGGREWFLALPGGIGQAEHLFMAVIDSYRR
jgi:hypothetical protein